MLTAIITTGLSIIYSFYYNNTLLNDFKIIPLLLIVLFLGIKEGLIIYFCTVVFRLLLGGVDLWTDLSLFTISAVIGAYFFVRIRRENGQEILQINEMSRVLLIIFLIKSIYLCIFNIDLLYKSSLYELIGSPILNIFTFVSILYLIKMNRLKNIMETEIIEAEKNKNVSQMAAAIAHEIRNPITVVKGFNQLIAQNIDKLSDEKILRYLDLCQTELDRAEIIIKEYLSFSKPTKEDMTIININESIERISAILISYSNMNNIILSTTSDVPEDICFWGYKEKFDQVVLNIVKNAIEACSQRINAKVNIQLKMLNNYIIVEILDNGIGISPENLKKLGDAYHTTKEFGTGLGLMVCRNLINQMNGKIDISSELGKGSNVRLTLPVLNE